MKIVSLALPLVLAVGCSSSSPEVSAQLAQLFLRGDNPIDLAQIGPSSWERVCALSPYTTNDRAERILGFKWNAEWKTDITTKEGITVLVFVRGKDVVAYTEHARGLGDLSELEPRCLTRASAKVVRRASHGTVHLVAQNAV